MHLTAQLVNGCVDVAWLVEFWRRPSLVSVEALELVSLEDCLLISLLSLGYVPPVLGLQLPRRLPRLREYALEIVRVFLAAFAGQVLMNGDKIWLYRATVACKLLAPRGVTPVLKDCLAGGDLAHTGGILERDRAT